MSVERDRTFLEQILVLTKLFIFISRCFTCTQSAEGTENDNCCQCHTAAVVNSLGVDEDDVLYLSFHNKVFHCINKQKVCVIQKDFAIVKP